MRRREEKVNRKWSADLAYAIGLIATDGSVSKDGRHINLTSKDLENMSNFQACLKISNKIGRKARGVNPKDKKYYVIQVGDVSFCEFLNDIGITPNKSKTISDVKIPRIYFPDFLRGCIDGDGSYGFSNHPETKIPQFKVRMCSASVLFLKFLKARVADYCKIRGGWITLHRGRSTAELGYGAMDSELILRYIYYENVKFLLLRKKQIADKFLKGRVA